MKISWPLFAKYNHNHDKRTGQFDGSPGGRLAPGTHEHYAGEIKLQTPGGHTETVSQMPVDGGGKLISVSHLHQATAGARSGAEESVAERNARLNAERMRDWQHKAHIESLHSQLPDNPTHFVPQPTKELAEAFATKHLAVSVVGYEHLPLHTANEINRAIFESMQRAGTTRKLARINYMHGENPKTSAIASVAGDSIMNIYPIARNPKLLARYVKITGSPETQRARADNLDRMIEKARASLSSASSPEHAQRLSDRIQLLEGRRDRIRNDPNSSSTRYFAQGTVHGLVTHEIGHVLSVHAWDQMSPEQKSENLRLLGAKDTSSDVSELSDRGRAAALRISRYAKTNVSEHFAEAWTEFVHNGLNPARIPADTRKAITQILEWSRHGQVLTKAKRFRPRLRP